jgi:hypothetical protein
LLAKFAYLMLGCFCFCFCFALLSSFVVRRFG